jgi:hypothetical protein
MARITPKTNWVANNIPVAPDFNRIENNNEQAFAELDQASVNLSAEQSARISADNTLQNNINAANAARISADNTLQNNINGKANNAVIGNNGGVGSIVTIASTFTPVGGGFSHTWTVPHSGVWFLSFYNIYFSGSSYTRTLTDNFSVSHTLWRIG